MQNKDLFTEESLKKLKTPDRLDALLPVTSSVSWMGLVALGIMVLSVVIWSIFGALIIKVEGVGLLLDAKGVIRVVSPSAGWVDSVNVAPNSVVKGDDVLVNVRMPEYMSDQQHSRSSMGETQSEREAANQLNAYNVNELKQYFFGLVCAPCNGIVGEVNVREGDFVQAGTTVCTVRNNEGKNDIHGVFYVQALEGKKILPGMTIQLVPSGFDGIDDGQLLGVVRSVSDYPVSATSVIASTGNDAVAQAILSQLKNAVVEVKFDLVKDATNDSGYLWTVKRNTGKKLTAGSMVSGFVVTDRKPPIEKVFYKISNWLRTR